MSKALDPQVRALIEQSARSPQPDFSEVGVVEARRIYKAVRLALRPPVPEVAEARDLSMPGPGGPLALRLYRAAGAAQDTALPAVVYFHGGGWVVGDLDTHDVVCRELANAARCVVVAVHYRLAPENKFPAAAEDAAAAVSWVAAHAAELGIDPERLAVAGESAGGNLAAVAALMLRDGGPRIAIQLLVYPATDMGLDTPSLQTYGGKGSTLTQDDMLWYRGQYLRSDADIDDWRASPLRAADLSRLPPAYIITAGFDPLLDEGRAYADKLTAAGVKVTYECFEGMVHGFLPMGGVLAASHHAIYRMAQFLRPVPTIGATRSM